MAPSLLDRFLNRGSGEAAKAADTSPVTSDAKHRAMGALERVTMHDQLGPARHLLALTLTDAGLQEYLSQNSDAADAIEYCYYRFSQQEIPTELKYMRNEFFKILDGYAVELLGKGNVNGVRKLLRNHLRGFRGTESAVSFFSEEHTARLLSRMKDVLDLIEKREEDYISEVKADHLLENLGMFVQNHYSTASYLYYDSKPQDRNGWSDETKFALSYLISPVPLDRSRLDLLASYVRKTTAKEGGESELDDESYTPERKNEIQAQLFSADIQQETLVHGLQVLEDKMAGLSEAVRKTLRSRFERRHLEYWAPLKERVQKLTASNIDISL